MAKQEPLLRVERPEPEIDRPNLSRVGVVAALGFVIGIAWPRLAGFHLAPTAPIEATKPQGEVAPESSSPTAEAKPAVTQATRGTESPQKQQAPVQADEHEQRVVVDPGRLERCVDKRDKSTTKCGDFEFDPIALPRLRALSNCPAAVGLTAKVDLGLDVNFDKKRVNVLLPKKTSVPISTVNGIVQCATREFANTPFGELSHAHRRYTLSYPVSFVAPGKRPEHVSDEETANGGNETDSPAAEAPDAQPADTDGAASGFANVGWDTALVRDEPKSKTIVMRLARGTRVKLLARRNDWFRVQHGAKTGWVARGALEL